MHGRLDAIEALVEAGASVNRKDVQGGFTPLHLAADAGQCEAVETLVRLGAQLDPRSAQGWTPLGLATLKVIGWTCIRKHDSRCHGQVAPAEVALHAAVQCRPWDWFW